MLLTCCTLALALAPAPQELAERIDAYLAPFVELDLFAGTVLVARGDEVVTRVYGRADLGADRPNAVDTRFKLMSTSKPFTALAVVTLAEEGRLDLDDPVARHLSGWPEAWQTITVRDLMAHATGLPDHESVLYSLDRGTGRQVAWSVLAPALATLPAGGPRGARFAYSNFHYVVLGCLLEELTGQPYPDVIRERVLEPAGMSATGFDDGGPADGLATGYFWGPDGDPDESEQDMSGIQAAGGIYSSAGDLARLHRALASRAIVGEAAWADMTAPVVAPLSSGWFLNPVAGRPCVGHSGGANGYVADFLHFPDDDACVVVLSNYAFAPIARLSHGVAKILFDEEPAPLVVPDRDEIAVLAGVYRASEGGTTLVVRAVGATLSVCPLVEGRRSFATPLLPRGPLHFETHGGALRFLGNEEVNYRGEVLSRVTVDEAPWRESAGRYESDQVVFSLTEEGGRLTLHVEHDRHPDHVVVPLDAGEALTLSHGGFGARLTRVPETAGEPARLAWTRFGHTLEARAVAETDS